MPQNVFVLDTAQKRHAKNVSRLMFVSGTSLLVLLMYNLFLNHFTYCYISFLPAKVAINE